MADMELSFLSHGQRCKPGEVDLHGLRIIEAEIYTNKSIQEARQRGETAIRLIVG